MRKTRLNLKTATLNSAGSLLIGCTVGPPAGPGADLYKKRICHTCRGEDGAHPVTADYPVVAGQPEKYRIRLMNDIRDGRLTNGLLAVMGSAVFNVPEEEFEQIAAWLTSTWELNRKAAQIASKGCSQSSSGPDPALSYRRAGSGPTGLPYIRSF